MKYFNVTQEELDQKMFNIFIGISMGNKVLTPELAQEYVKWAHTYTKEHALVLIADKIDSVNWQVFQEMSENDAEKKIEQKAYGLSGMFEKAKRTLARKEDDLTYITNIHTIFWSDIENWGYSELRNILGSEYKTNSEFKTGVLKFVGKYIELRNVEVTEEDRERLGGYILDELPTLLGGILWNSTLYNLMLYPTYVDSGMSQFVLDVRNGKYFDPAKLQLRQVCVLVEDHIKEK